MYPDIGLIQVMVELHLDDFDQLKLVKYVL